MIVLAYVVGLFGVAGLLGLGAELQTHEAWTREQIAAHQLTAIQLTLDHARSTVPFYKNYACSAIHSFEDLHKLPVIKRETVRENQGRLLSNLVSPTQRIQALGA